MNNGLLLFWYCVLGFKISNIITTLGLLPSLHISFPSTNWFGLAPILFVLYIFDCLPLYCMEIVIIICTYIWSPVLYYGWMLHNYIAVPSLYICIIIAIYSLSYKYMSLVCESGEDGALVLSSVIITIAKQITINIACVCFIQSSYSTLIDIPAQHPTDSQNPHWRKMRQQGYQVSVAPLTYQVSKISPQGPQ